MRLDDYIDQFPWAIDDEQDDECDDTETACPYCGLVDCDDHSG